MRLNAGYLFPSGELMVRPFLAHAQFLIDIRFLNLWHFVYFITQALNIGLLIGFQLGSDINAIILDGFVVIVCQQQVLSHVSICSWMSIFGLVSFWSFSKPSIITLSLLIHAKHIF